MSSKQGTESRFCPLFGGLRNLDSSHTIDETIEASDPKLAIPVPLRRQGVKVKGPRSRRGFPVTG
jgi:hypothetical protein